MDTIRVFSVMLNLSLNKGLLLGDAVDRPAMFRDGDRIQSDHLTVWKLFPNDRQTILVIFIAEHGN